MHLLVVSHATCTAGKSDALHNPSYLDEKIYTTPYTTNIPSETINGHIT